MTLKCVKSIGIISLILASSLTEAKTLKESEIAAKNVFLSLMRDPDSVKFGKFTQTKSMKFACLSANGKNRYGAYEGYTHFKMFFLEDVNHWAVTNDYGLSTHEECVKAIQYLDYYSTPEGIKQQAKEDKLRKQKDDARWAEINKQSEAESLKSNQERKAYADEMEARLKKEEEVAKNNHIKEQAANDEEQKKLIEASKKDGDNFNKESVENTNNEKSLGEIVKSMKDLFSNIK